MTKAHRRDEKYSDFLLERGAYNLGVQAARVRKLREIYGEGPLTDFFERPSPIFPEHLRSSPPHSSRVWGISDRGFKCGNEAEKIRLSDLYTAADYLQWKDIQRRHRKVQEQTDPVVPAPEKRQVPTSPEKRRAPTPPTARSPEENSEQTEGEEGRSSYELRRLVQPPNRLGKSPRFRAGKKKSIRFKVHASAQNKKGRRF